MRPPSQARSTYDKTGRPLEKSKVYQARPVWNNAKQCSEALVLREMPIAPR
jgi:hypothetical protein